MTNNDYTRNILNLKDENIHFYENCLETVNIKGKDTKVFKAFLSYTPSSCPKCGHVNEGFDDIIKLNFKRNCKIKLPKVFGYNTLLLLNKQRFYCKHCNHTFTATTSLVKPFKNISENARLAITLDLMNKDKQKFSNIMR